MNLCHFNAYAGKKICIALSGGIDSVVLLHCALQQSKQFALTVSALTCEHGIRGEASCRDLAFVERLCADWNVPLAVFRADVPARAKLNGRGLEEEGRAFRYECFASVLKSGAADFVATAHHRDDLAETVLFRLARGTSVSGLNAIRERDGILRPLLNLSRADIQSYAKEHGLAYVQDESNRDEAYARNRIRHTVLPALESVVHGAGEHLVQFAFKAEEDESFLQALTREGMGFDKNEVRFAATLPQPLFGRACVIAFRELGLNDYTAKNVEEVVALKELQSGKRACLPCGLEAVREGEYIVVYRPQAGEQGEVSFTYGNLPFGEHTVCVRKQATAGALYADKEAFPADCAVRTRREGDTFQPFGGNKKTLKEFLTDKKIPARLGRKLPLIASGNEILVICGVEISDKVKVTETTKERVYITVK